MENLPDHIIEKIYKLHFQHHIFPGLKCEIEHERLLKVFRDVQSIIGMRNASWGFIYHLLTDRIDEPIRYKYVTYEDKVYLLWSNMSHEERDSLERIHTIHSYLLSDEGLLYVDFMKK